MPGVDILYTTVGHATGDGRHGPDPTGKRLDVAVERPES
jgi:hypothetical protein